MESLGVAANVIAVVDLSAKLVGLCVRYAIDVKNSNNNKARLMNEITALHSISQKAKDLLEGSHGARLRASREFADAIGDGESQLERLKNQLSEAAIAQSHTVWRELQWPFERQNIDNTVQNLAKCADRISLTLQIDQTTLIVDMDQRAVLSQLPIAHGASFDSYCHEHGSFCLPDTRVELLRLIANWADDPDAESIFWLNGMAGTGKSTISRTAAQIFAEKGYLGASFFYKRGETDRGNLAKFFTTIAADLTVRKPTTATQVKESLDADPTIISKNTREQFDNLFLYPLSKVTEKDTPVVIIVDALDECDRDADIRLLIHLFSRAGTKLSRRVKIFVTSRPDLPLQLGFQSIKGAYQDLILHDMPEPVIEQDISIFFKYQLARIRDEYDSFVAEEERLSEGWPGPSKIDALTKIASPLFIAAATICLFISDIKIGIPQKQLNKVLYRAGEEISQLGPTYLSVLDNQITGLSMKHQKEVLQQFRKIVGSIVILASPLSTTALARLLSLPRDEINGRLVLLHSVLSVPLSVEAPVRLLHLSFRDFLVDTNKAAKPFWIDEKKAQADMAANCLRVLGCLKKNLCNLKAPGTPRSAISPEDVNTNLPPEIQYACLYWAYHIEQADTYICDDSKAYCFLECHFLHWIEALALIGSASESLGIIKTLQSRLENQKSDQLCHLLKDAFRFLRSYMVTIDNTPLQLYSSCIIFTPKNSVIRALFEGEATWISLKPQVVDDWSQCVQTLEGHDHPVTSVAFSPNGQQLASGSYDNNVKLWDVATGTCQQTLRGHGCDVQSVAFSPNGRQLASGSCDNTIMLWDAATGIWQQTLRGHNKSARSVKFSPDGQQIASGSDDSTIKLWHIAAGICQQTLTGHDNLVCSIAFSPDGQHLVSGSFDKTIKLWDLVTGKCQQTIRGHDDLVMSVAFSPNGQQLVSGSLDKSIKLWSVATAKCQQTLSGHDNLVSSIALSPDGQQLASSGFGNTIKLWDIAKGTCQMTLKGHHYTAMSLAFSPNGQQLASSSLDRTIKLWDMLTAKCQQTLSGHDDLVSSVAFSPDGQQLASGSYDKTIKLWDVTTGIYQQTLYGHGDLVMSVAFSLNGQQLASGSSDKTIRIWDAAIYKCQQTLRGHDDCVQSIVFSPDGQQLASGSFDKTIKLWDLATGRCQQTLSGHHGIVDSVAFSLNGQQLASSSYDKTIKLWDVATGTCQQTLYGHGDMVRSVAFSLNGQQLISGSSDKTNKLWDLATGKRQNTFKSHYRNVYPRVFFLENQQPTPCDTDNSVQHRIPQFSLSHDCRWLLQDNEPIIWLPAEFEAVAFATVESVVAWGCLSGRVMITHIP